MVRKYNLVIDLDVNSISLTLGYVEKKVVRILDSVSVNVPVFEDGLIKNIENVIKNIYSLSDVIKKDLNINDKLNPVSCAIVFSSVNCSYIAYKMIIYTDPDNQKLFTSSIISKGINDFKHNAKPKDPEQKLCTYVPYLFNIDSNGLTGVKSTRVYPLNEVGDGAQVFLHCIYINNALANQFETIADRLDFCNINYLGGPFIRQHYIAQMTPFDIGNSYFMLNIGKNYSELSYALNNSIKSTELLRFGLLDIFNETCSDLKLDINTFAKIVNNYGLIEDLKIDFKISDTKLVYSEFKKCLESKLKKYCYEVNELIDKTKDNLKNSDSYTDIIISGDIYMFTGLFEYLQKNLNLNALCCQANVPGVKLNNNLSILGAFLCLSDLNWQKRSDDVDITSTKTISMTSLRKNTED